MDNTDLSTYTCPRKLSQNMSWYIITSSEINIVLAAGLMSACDKHKRTYIFTKPVCLRVFYETGFAYVK